MDHTHLCVGFICCNIKSLGQCELAKYNFKETEAWIQDSELISGPKVWMFRLWVFVRLRPTPRQAVTMCLKPMSDHRITYSVVWLYKRSEINSNREPTVVVVSCCLSVRLPTVCWNYSKQKLKHHYGNERSSKCKLWTTKIYIIKYQLTSSTRSHFIIGYGPKTNMAGRLPIFYGV